MPSKQVTELSVQCIESQAIPFDFSQGWTETWDITLELTDEEIENEEYTPRMNFIYPLPDTFVVPHDFRKKLNNTTIVYMMEEDRYYLALTGGGMDMSWEICESYINLGFLPPAHFATLPQIAGRGESREDRKIIRACRESLWLAHKWAKDRLVDFDNKFKRKR